MVLSVGNHWSVISEAFLRLECQILRRFPPRSRMATSQTSQTTSPLTHFQTLIALLAVVAVTLLQFEAARHSPVSWLAMRYAHFANCADSATELCRSPRVAFPLQHGMRGR